MKTTTTHTYVDVWKDTSSELHPEGQRYKGLRILVDHKGRSVYFVGQTVTRLTQTGTLV